MKKAKDIKNLVIFFILTTCLLSCPVRAMVVFDPTVNMTLIMEFAKDIEQLQSIFHGLNDVKETLNSDINDTKSTLNNDLTTPYVGLNELNIRQKLQDLSDTLNKSTEYSYQASATSKDTLFAGYKMPNGKTYQDQYADITNNLQNLLNNVLASMQTNAQHFDTENQDLQDMQSRANAAKTQMQIAQSGAQIAAEGVNQMQLMRQTMIAQTNAQTAYYAAQTQKEASARADMSNIIQAGSDKIDGKLDVHPLDLPKL